MSMLDRDECASRNLNGLLSSRWSAGCSDLAGDLNHSSLNHTDSSPVRCARNNVVL